MKRLRCRSLFDRNYWLEACGEFARPGVIPLTLCYRMSMWTGKGMSKERAAGYFMIGTGSELDSHWCH